MKPESLFRILSATLPKVKIGDVNYVLTGYKSKENVYGLEETTLIFEAQPLVDDFVIRVDLVGNIIDERYTTWMDKFDINHNSNHHHRGNSYPYIVFLYQSLELSYFFQRI